MTDNILKATELTGILGRSEFDKLSKIHGNDWINYRSAYNKASELELLDFPIQLDIELNASCNLKCPMCPISAESPNGKGKSTWFPFEFFQQIINYAVKNGTKALKLNYVNEPLIRNDLYKFIDFAKKSGILDVYLSTNGVLMTEKFINQFIDLGLTRLQVSIDATTDEVYNQMRPGGSYEKVINNINNFLKIKKERSAFLPILRVNFVKTELNEHQLDEFISLWKEKVDMIGIQEFIKPTKSIIEIKSKKSIKKDSINFKCSFPFKQLVITNEFDVLPCCTFWGEELSLGKLKQPEDLKLFWNSLKIKHLREIHKKGQYHSVHQCKECVEGGVS